MQTFSPLAILVVVAAVVLGLPIGLYLLLTRGQRRSARAIRLAAAERGWRSRRRFWRANSAALCIEGHTRGGLAFTLTSGDTQGTERGWCVQMGIRFPSLGGPPDVSVLPRESSAVPPRGQRANAAIFFQYPVEMASGLPAFDAAYQVLVKSGSFRKPPVDRALAGRFLYWPSEAIVPHTLLAWRDLYSLQVHVRLPAEPNWATVSYLADIASDFAARIPPGDSAMAAPPGLVHRMVYRLLQR